MKTILFQGDSITDCGRSRENDVAFGTGYPLLVKAQLGYEQPNNFRFYNRGISGNRIVDVYARIKMDIINLKPDYMSLLIGVNDVWHEFGRHNGVAAEKFEKIYCMLIEEIREALPDIRIMIMEPFCMEGAGTQNTEEIPDKWEQFRGEVAKRAACAKRVAEKYGLVFVPLQDALDRAAEETADPTYWLGDGVHPTAMGHELLKREWFKGFAKLEKDN